MKITCGVYKITSPSGKIYVGQSICIEQRLKEYVKFKKKSQTKIYHSIRKYGFEAHKVEIIFVCIPDDLDYFERFYINLYDSFNTDHGLNLTQGGKMYRGRMADTTRVKHRNYRHSAEAKAKIGNAHRGSKRSEEARAKMRKPHRKSTKTRKMVVRVCTAVYAKDSDGLILKFLRMKDCSAITGVSVGAIVASIKAKRVSKGYCFSYSDYWPPYRVESLRGKNSPKTRKAC